MFFENRILFDRCAAIAAIVCLLLPILAMTGAAAQTVPADQPTSEDVAVRDNLIANQENLLNTYRCLFGVDVDVVPGGCPDPDEVSPGVAPETPTQQDIDVRDKLIANQEALLNVYRCQYNVDTQIVPGGCDAAEPDPTETAQPAENAFIAVEVGAGDRNDTCAIRADHTMVCWDRVWDREAAAFRWVELEVPDGRFAAVSTNSGHSCALRVDQSLACWIWGQGSDSLVELEVPDGHFIAVTATTGISNFGWCAIWIDHVLFCNRVTAYWDSATASYRYGYVELDVPEGQFTAIAGTAGASQGNGVCAIQRDRSLACWDWERDSDSLVELDVPDGEFTAVAVGYSHSCAIRVDGTIACWGASDFGQTDAPEGRFTAITAALLVPGDGIEGFEHSCAIRVDGTIACWGAGENLGFDLGYLNALDAPDGQFTAISTGHGSSCAIRVGGTIACWPSPLNL